jgi:hypothetical protein
MKLLLILLALILLAATTSEAAPISVMRYWTCPYDNVGVVEYKMHWSRTPAGADTLAWWRACEDSLTWSCSAIAGALDSVSVNVSTVGTWYYNIVSRDAMGNQSKYSNIWMEVLADTQIPFPVTTLH